jgi:hypothetical protein
MIAALYANEQIAAAAAPGRTKRRNAHRHRRLLLTA